MKYSLRLGFKKKRMLLAARNRQAQPAVVKQRGIHFSYITGKQVIGVSLLWFSSSIVSGPTSLQFFWPLSYGHDMAIAAPGIIPMFKAGRRGKRVLFVWCVFSVTEKQNIP